MVLPPPQLSVLEGRNNPLPITVRDDYAWRCAGKEVLDAREAVCEMGGGKIDLAVAPPVFDAEHYELEVAADAAVRGEVVRLDYYAGVGDEFCDGDCDWGRCG